MIKVNTSMIKRCSRGVQRYYNEIISNITVDYIVCDKVEDSFCGYFTTSPSNVIVWSPGQGGSIVSRRHIVTCHDVIDFTFYEKLFKNRIKKIIHNYIYSRAKEIVFISESTKDEFIRVFPRNKSKKSVIKSAIRMNPIFNYQPEVFSRYGLIEDGYFLLITNAMPHKNNRIFIDAMKVISEIGAVGVIIGSLSKNDRDEISSCRNIIHLLNVNDDELFSLIKGSKALVSPSFVEGHNLVIAEALTLEKNVIASDIPVHREFYSDLCILFDCDDFVKLSNILTLTLTNDIQYPKFNVENFRSWEETSREYVMLFENKDI